MDVATPARAANPERPAAVGIVKVDGLATVAGKAPQAAVLSRDCVIHETQVSHRSCIRSQPAGKASNPSASSPAQATAIDGPDDSDD